MEQEEEEEAACRKADPKEHYPPCLGARCLALPQVSLREELVGWGTARGLRGEITTVRGLKPHQLTFVGECSRY